MKKRVVLGMSGGVGFLCISSNFKRSWLRCKFGIFMKIGMKKMKMEFVQLQRITKM